MSSVIDLNSNEVKVLLSSLHNLVLDREVVDYLKGIDNQVSSTIETLICKFEDVFKG